GPFSCPGSMTVERRERVGYRAPEGSSRSAPAATRRVRRPLDFRTGAPVLSYDRASLPTSNSRRPQRSSGGPQRRDNRSGRRPYRKNDRRPNGHRSDRRAFDPARRAAIEAFDPADAAFSALAVPESVVKILGVDGIVEPTAVQAAVLPDAMAGRDVLGRARTGSGKTLAFGLPTLPRLSRARSAANHPRAVTGVPTPDLPW